MAELMSKPRILVYDIETSPLLAWSFERWKTNIYPSQVVQDVRVMCFAAKWAGEKRMMFEAGDWAPNGSDVEMASRMADLLDQADAVVTFNGATFDDPHVNRLMEGLHIELPSPTKQLDLRRVAKQKFNFPYNSLDAICAELGIGRKMKHQGLELWLRCIAGDPKAWRTFERYNRQDVLLTEALYDRLLPYIPGHPSHAVFSGQDVCPQCGSDELAPNGHAYTATGKYQRYRCLRCGAYPRSTRRIEGSGLTITRG